MEKVLLSHGVTTKVLYQNSVNLWRARLLLYIAYFTALHALGSWLAVDAICCCWGEFYKWSCSVRNASSAKRRTRQRFTEFDYSETEITRYDYQILYTSLTLLHHLAIVFHTDEGDTQSESSYDSRTRRRKRWEKEQPFSPAHLNKSYKEHDAKQQR